jgi:rhodanese-related sulfurtransferase
MGIRYLVWFAVVAIAIYVAYKLYAYATDSPHRIDASAARRRLAAGEIDYVLDVRTALERDALGYFPQSIHIPGAELRRRVEREIPNKGAAILVYCNTGQRARAATDLLHRLGYRNSVYIATAHTSLME